MAPHTLHNLVTQVRCLGTACPDWEGQNCVYNGKSDIWKVCNDRTCSFAPNLPKTSLDKCDPLEVVFDTTESVDLRASAYCEYRNWRAAGNQSALTGHTGRCSNSDPTKCHGGSRRLLDGAVAACGRAPRCVHPSASSKARKTDTMCTFCVPHLARRQLQHSLGVSRVGSESASVWNAICTLHAVPCARGRAGTAHGSHGCLHPPRNLQYCCNAANAPAQAASPTRWATKTTTVPARRAARFDSTAPPVISRPTTRRARDRASAA